MTPRRSDWRQVAFLSCVALAAIPPSAPAQILLSRPIDQNTEPILPGLCLLQEWSGTTGDPALANGRAARFQMFRMPTAFLGDPVGMDIDDEGLPGESTADMSASLQNDGRFWIAMGADNPFFDLRAPGDPGGVGYYRVKSQYLLVDGPSSNLCFGIDAAAPAGIDAQGVGDGRTVIRPSLAYFQELSFGTAIQGFVGKNVCAQTHWSDNLERSVRYGMAFQSPIPGLTGDRGQGLHLFVEALGYSRYVPDSVPRQPPRAEILPGLHMRMTDNCWMSGGYVLPMGPVHSEIGIWQFTWSWRF